MNQTYDLEANSYIGLLCLIVFGCIGIFLVIKIIREWRVVRNFSSAPKPTESVKEWEFIGKVARYQLFKTALFLVVTLALIFLISLNAVVWFRSIEVSTNDLQLRFSLGKTISLERNDVSTVKIISSRRGKRLQIITMNGKRFRSVSITDSNLLAEVKQSIETK